MDTHLPLRTRVEPSDLEKLPLLHEILSLLADPAVSADQLGRVADRLPVLANRLKEAARGLKRSRRTAGESIVVLGNRGFEAILLELLEDLTVLRADLDDAGCVPELVLDRQPDDDRRSADAPARPIRANHHDPAGPSLAPCLHPREADG